PRGLGAFRFQAELREPRLKPEQPARGTGRGSINFSGARQDPLARAEGLLKVVRGKADFLLRQGQSKFLPHRTAHPRIATRIRRPAPLVEAAEDDEVGAPEPPFDRAPYAKARMQAKGRAHHPPAHQRAEELRPGCRAEILKHVGGTEKLGEECRRRLAEAAPPERGLRLALGR